MPGQVRLWVQASELSRAENGGTRASDPLVQRSSSLPDRARRTVL